MCAPLVLDSCETQMPACHLPILEPVRGFSSLVCFQQPFFPFECRMGRRACACVCSVSSGSLGPHACSPPGASVHGVFQARTLEWGAISYSRRSSGPKDQTCVFCNSRIGKQILYTESPAKLPICPQLFTNLSYMITLLRTVPKWPSTILATQD